MLLEEQGKIRFILSSISSAALYKQTLSLPKAVVCVAGELQESAWGTWEHTLVVLRTLHSTAYNLIQISKGVI